MLPKNTLVAVSLLVAINYVELAKIVDIAKIKSDDWWRDAVLYQIDISLFKDSNNDGVGDIKGATEKLEHLKDAGVNGALISPVFKSNGIGNEYGIVDFVEVDSKLGSLRDFDEMVSRARELGIRILMDFIPTYTSNKHEWFQRSANNEAGFENFYVWRDGRGFGLAPDDRTTSNGKDSAWTYDENRNQWYLHRSNKEQPDLNYENPSVKQHIEEVIVFWMKRGIDGFRIRSIENVEFPNDNSVDKFNEFSKTQENILNLVYDLRHVLDKYNHEHGGESRILIVESDSKTETVIKYYGSSYREGAHLVFTSPFANTLNINSKARDIVSELEKHISKVPERRVISWMATNHATPQTATKFGANRIDGWNTILAFLPGVMVTYNGEEIAQEDDVGLLSNKDTKHIQRTAFSWDDSVNAGFNDGSQKPWRSINANYVNNNLATQSRLGRKSHYHTYQTLLKLRQIHGFNNAATAYSVLENDILIITKTISSNEVYVAVINTGDAETNINLSHLNGLHKNLKVVTSDSNSKKHRRVLPANNIILSPHESFVAKALPEVRVGDLEWFKTTVIYQIYILSFKDSNNDGIGDIQGIISKLQHLADTGVKAIWISSIYQSPHFDQGDDVSDYNAVDSRFGDLDDFDELIQTAHGLGIKVIMDFIPNHSSDQHDWFQRSLKREPDYEDYYVWRNAPLGQIPNNWLSLFKNSAWELHANRRQFYLHHLSTSQPEYNYRSDAVKENMLNVLEFWLSKGVDGFVVDSAQYLYEHDSFQDETPLDNDVPENEHGSLNHEYTSDQPETYDIIYGWRQFLDDYSAQDGGDARILITEVNTALDKTMQYYGDGTRNGAHIVFNYQLISELDQGLQASTLSTAITDWIDALPNGITPNWLLGNHDNHRVATRLGPDNVDGLNMLTAFLPGTMVTYNGEEIGQENGEVSWREGKDPNACGGLRDDFEETSRDFQRTPFHWDSSPNAGFNEGGSPWLPISQKYSDTNLAAQSDPDVSSHYQIYKQLIELRQEAILVGGSTQIQVVSTSVLSCTRSITEGETEEEYLLVFNVGDQAQTLNLRDLFGIDSTSVRVVVASSNSLLSNGAITNPATVQLEPHECLIVEPSNEEYSSSSTSTPSVTSTTVSSSVTTTAHSSTSTFSSTVTEPPSSPETPSSPSSQDPPTEPDGAGAISISLVALFISIYCGLVMRRF